MAVWVYDWQRDTLGRVTHDFEAAEGGPVWTPDGRRIVFAASERAGGPSDLHWQAADGSGEPEPLTHTTNRQGAGSGIQAADFSRFRK
jgi:Tol biopolymer transport system component